MEFNRIDWADSLIENIYIEYNHAKLLIWNDAYQRKMIVDCYGLAGITNLCIWDDLIISDVTVISASESNSQFIRNLFCAYDVNADYGGRLLSEGFVEIKIELENSIVFSIYCQKIDVNYYEA